MNHITWYQGNQGRTEKRGVGGVGGAGGVRGVERAGGGKGAEVAYTAVIGAELVLVGYIYLQLCRKQWSCEVSA